MSVHNVLPGLHLVDLDQTLTGFRQFISCWVLTRGDRAVLVDPGPRSSIPTLLQALEQLEVRQVDAILLTHIHIDHAGGTGLLLPHFPDAQVICHPKGIAHMVDPSRLWSGSLKVLGEIAEAYGSIEPVPAEGIRHVAQLDLPPLQVEVIDTPGHAPHHLSFLVDGLLFAGEAAGVHVHTAAVCYQRPATPPVFKYEVSRASLDRLLECDAQHLCFGHYGYSDRPRESLEAARAQLAHWLEVVDRHRGEAESQAAAFAELQRTDPSYQLLAQLPADVQERERYFFANTFAGMAGHLEQR